MAAGIPVIATPVGGIVDFLRDGQTGLFCEVKKPESNALKVKIYLADKDLTEKIKANASELVKNNYDWNLLALKMKTNFEKIILKNVFFPISLIVLLLDLNIFLTKYSVAQITK